MFDNNIVKILLFEQVKIVENLPHVYLHYQVLHALLTFSLGERGVKILFFKPLNRIKF